VQKIIHLQEITNQLPDAFTDMKRVTKSYIPAVNSPARIEISKGQSENEVTNESKTRLKRGRPIGSKDKNPRKRKGVDKYDDPNVKECVSEEIQNKTNQEMKNPECIENYEISVDYVNTGGLWNRNKMKNMNEIFFYSVVCDIINSSEDPEPISVTRCQNRHDWIKWKDAILTEMNSLNKLKVFGPIILTPEAVRSVGYK